MALNVFLLEVLFMIAFIYFLKERRKISMNMWYFQISLIQHTKMHLINDFRNPSHGRIFMYFCQIIQTIPAGVHSERRVAVFEVLSR